VREGFGGARSPVNLLREALSEGGAMKNCWLRATVKVDRHGKLWHRDYLEGRVELNLVAIDLGEGGVELHLVAIDLQGNPHRTKFRSDRPSR
jgi:hypothetical protein